MREIKAVTKRLRALAAADLGRVKLLEGVRAAVPAVKLGAGGSAMPAGALAKGSWSTGTKSGGAEPGAAGRSTQGCGAVGTSVFPYRWIWGDCSQIRVDRSGVQPWVWAKCSSTSETRPARAQFSSCSRFLGLSACP